MTLVRCVVAVGGRVRWHMGAAIIWRHGLDCRQGCRQRAHRGRWRRKGAVPSPARFDAADGPACSGDRGSAVRGSDERRGSVVVCRYRWGHGPCTGGGRGATIIG
ncbi:hypothetical protein CH063_10201 [Colletotrichum higginsianum]|uniref:Uncharacterized protein n=1 Tax=Colletotrichum higginsianum (strain IMI 349063) TaxID=759273 RepID=H1VGI7_COLHI|nr:hypothetical protein CH063_10201 [Colletotrichum higginsianum]